MSAQTANKFSKLLKIAEKSGNFAVKLSKLIRESKKPEIRKKYGSDIEY